MIWVIDSLKEKEGFLLHPENEIVKQHQHYSKENTNHPQLPSVHHAHPKSCPTFCDPMDCGPPGSSVGGSPGKNTGVGCHFLLLGIFPTRGSNLVSCIANGFFTIEPPRKQQFTHSYVINSYFTES